MRILVSWLREIAPVTAGVGDLADALTRRGFEVSSIEPPPAAPGSAADGDDAVLDLEITANRPDCLGVVGIAREVSAIYDAELAWPALAGVGVGDGAPPVAVEDAARCPRYAAAVADVTVGPSPDWMTARLEAAGVRPVNNVVDVTNYVMIELGHPMHAFDLDRLQGGELRIRPARAGETVRTLDGVERSLDPGVLVIADAARAQAVAGVMGGADSQVTASTARVALESAWFDPVSVRRASRRLGLSTDASHRFERGADVEAPVRALRRAFKLLEAAGAGAPRGAIVDRYPAPRAAAVVTLRRARIAQVLGVDVEPDSVRTTLGRLGFGVEPAPADDAGTRWRVTAPSHRVDVGREIDLIEEVARHYGYDRLPSTFPALVRPPAPASGGRAQRRLVGRMLAASGCSEAITYGFIDEAAALPFVDRAEDLARIANPLSETSAVLRPSLIPGLVDALVHNLRRERSDVRLFTIGRRFTASAGETWAAAVAITGPAAPEHWSDGRRWPGGAPAADFFDAAGIADRVCEACGVEAAFAAAARRPLVEGRTAVAQAAAPGDAAPVPLGHVGRLDPEFAAARGLPSRRHAVYVAELDLGALARVGVDRRRMTATPLPRHPSVVRDLAVVVDAALPAATVRGTIRSAAPDTLLRVREFDRYAGTGIPDGRVSLALRLTFRSPERTLTDAEIDRAMGAIVARLEAAHGAKLR